MALAISQLPDKFDAKLLICINVAKWRYSAERGRRESLPVDHWTFVRPPLR
jgi:hypothetical protein